MLLDFGLILNLKPQIESDIEEPTGQPRYQAVTDNMISGTISYMAPEQATGSPLQDSSDWYAFGVMLFEALTGRLPFRSRGAEMVRAKLEKDAPPPSRFAPETPPDLDQLCIELLNRDPKLRPVGGDVLQRLSGESTVVEDGMLNQHIFIGRESYLARLNDSFAQLEKGKSEVLCVHGRSGVGKTALIQHFLEQTVLTRNGILLAGRCYEQESVPYKAIDNLIDALTELLLEMPAARLEQVLPPDIQALARVFPVLKRVKSIGGSTAGVANDPILVRRQAFLALGQLLTAIGEKQPLVLYIDDLQWGDTDSAQLLSSLLTSEPRPRMLVLLSYRGEYAANACLREFRRAWESSSIPHYEMEVLPLSTEESRELTTRLLAGTPAADRLIERIVEQARGSAFFVQELAEHARSGIDWQSTTATDRRGRGSSGDLDDVLWHRVQKLPTEARELLEMIAVAGQPIQFRELVHARDFAAVPQHAVNQLRSARLVRSTGTRLTDQIEAFHDRVRESIASHLSAPVSRDYHLRIANALEANGEAAPETVASHLNSAASPRASHFYELAGQRAMQVLAFDRAEEYFKLAAHIAPTPTDRARVEERLIHFYTNMARFKEAYSTGRDAVARFGVKLPKKFVPPLLIIDVLYALIRKGRRKPSELLDLPAMTDERQIIVVRLIAAMGKAAYQVRPEICVSICTRAVNICLKRGNTPDAAINYMVFGCIFLGGIVGRAKTGYEYGRLALDLVDKFQNHEQRAEVNFVVGYFGTSWMRPAIEAELLWETAFEEGQRTGDLFHTGCAVSGTIQSMIMRGAPLAAVEHRIEQFWPVMEQAHLREPLTCLASTRELIRNLQASAPSAADQRMRRIRNCLRSLRILVHATSRIFTF